MKKLKVPSIVTILVLTLITILFWIIFGVVRIFTSKPATSIAPEVTEPLNPNFDKETVDKIVQRIYFDKELVFQTVEPSPSPEASPSATPEAATESADLDTEE